MRTQRNNEDEEPVGTLGFSVKSRSANIFSVFIDEEIKEPSYYSKIFSMLMDASDHDIVDFFIASPGGRIDGLSVILEGIKMTDAHTRAVILSSAHSAASVLALHCDEVIVTDSAEMLVHSCRYGAGGKSADVEAHVLHNKKTSERLIRNTYQGFLSPQELQEMLNGREIYLTAEDIRTRLKDKIAFDKAADSKEPQKPKRKPKKQVEAQIEA